MTPFFSRSEPMSPTPDDVGILTATRPEPSPWKGWKRDHRNQTTTAIRTRTAPRNMRPRRLTLVRGSRGSRSAFGAFGGLGGLGAFGARGAFGGFSARGGGGTPL